MPSLKQNESAAIVLRKAKELIETKGWTQDAYAVDPEGEECNPENPSAIGFCIEGALHAASHTPWNEPTRNIPGYEVLSKLAESNGLAYWNDKLGRTRDDVLELLDRALAESKS